MKEIFKFAHSTKSKSDVPTGSDDIRGFGLPLCRIYARYFGGELTLKSMEGYGLDAYLYLPRLGDACENLPPTVKASPGGQISLPTWWRQAITTITPTAPLIIDIFTHSHACWLLVLTVILVIPWRWFPLSGLVSEYWILVFQRSITSVARFLHRDIYIPSSSSREALC